MVHPSSGTVIAEVQVPRSSYISIFLRFLRFGLFAWGGPVAQIAMIRQELVEDERWISKERFNRVLGVYQILPGPEAHELCCYFGMLAGGRIGSILAGVGFMLPGFILMIVVSWWFVNIGSETPVLGAFFLGFAPAVAALVVRGTHRIAQPALHDKLLWTIGLTSAVLTLIGTSFIIVLALGAVAYPILKSQFVSRFPLITTAFILAMAPTAIYLTYSLHDSPLLSIFQARETQNSFSTKIQEAVHKPSMAELGSSGLRAGLLTFGGAYTSIPFVQQDAVTNGKWLSNKEFFEGLALAGMLPAPLIIFTTFVGYVAGGFLGAVVITLGVFLPAFSFTLIGHQLFEKILEVGWLHGALDGVTASVVGLIAITAITLVLHAVTSLSAIFVLAGSLILLYTWSSKFTVPITIILSGLLQILFA
jgi:chromate transporter